MKCPHCGFEFSFHKNLPELNNNQKKILNFCKDKPRYMFEIAESLYGPNDKYGHVPATLSCINSLINRKLLRLCKPNEIPVVEISDGRSKRIKKYYKTINL